MRVTWTAGWVGVVLAVAVCATDAMADGETLVRSKTAQAETRPAVSPRELIDRGNRALMGLYGAGRFAEGVALAERLQALAREHLAPDDPIALTVMNNLAFLYYHQGRYGAAEPLYLEALERRRAVLGDDHPSTLVSVNNLASLYSRQGRYGAAEPLFLEALERRRAVLGDDHPDTLVSVNNLASLYESQGRYGVAEPLFLEALERSRAVLGDDHPSMLVSVNNLAFLYYRQGRYGAAEPLFLEALERSRAVLGGDHPSTLGSVNNLASLYESQGRYGAAEPLYLEALERSRAVLGDDHPDTLGSVNNLALLYSRQGRYGAAELLYLETLERSRAVLGNDHPSTLVSVNNLAFLYQSQGRYGAAEPLYLEALERSRAVLRDDHPDTLTSALNYVGLLVRTDRAAEVAARLERLGRRLLRWTGVQLATTRQAATKRLLLNRQGTFQHVAIDLAARHRSPRTSRLAADTMMRWKQLAGEEESYLARLVRRTDDSRVRTLGTAILQLRSELGVAYHQGHHELATRILTELEHQEAALSGVSEGFRQWLGTRTAGSREVETNLPEGAALVEFRLYRPFDYDAGTFVAPHWAAVVLRPYQAPAFADLGPWEVPVLLNRIMIAGDTAPEQRDQAAATLYATLFGPFDAALAAAETVYLAPDGPLALIPFDRLRLADGRYWIERQPLRILHSGRAVIEARRRSPNRGFFGVGGIAFGEDAAPAGAARDDRGPAVPAAVDMASLMPVSLGALRAARGRLSGTVFTALDATRDEVDLVAGLYEDRRREQPTVLTGAAARETVVKALAPPPRVAHFATHGFTLEAEGEVARPMLLAGLTLAGANRGVRGVLDGDGEDGLLFALEAAGLNLERTELVVMSACDTGKGAIDYSEGVMGLARAFRIAGAQNVLMTLWPLHDGRARDFMVDFYGEWLKEADRDPVEALRAVKLDWAGSRNPRKADPIAWAPYVIVQAGR